jgi:hypothetical protein
MRAGVAAVSAFLILGAVASVQAQVDARMLRHPAVSETQIAFVLKQLEANPPKRPARPAYTDRSGR